MQAGPAPDLTAQQGAYVELQANGEQQQSDANLRDQREQGGLVVAYRVEHEAGGKEADQRW